MSRRSSTLGGAPTRTIVNAFSSGGVSAPNVHAGVGTNLAREVLSGALTAGVLKKVLSVSGGGLMPILSAYSRDTTPRTIRVQVVVDGQASPAFDATTNTINTINTGIPVIGTADGSYFGPSESIRSNSLVEVWVASSLTETDKIAIAYKVN